MANFEPRGHKTIKHYQACIWGGLPNTITLTESYHLHTVPRLLAPEFRKENEAEDEMCRSGWLDYRLVHFHWKVWWVWFPNPNVFNIIFKMTYCFRLCVPGTFLSGIPFPRIPWLTWARPRGTQLTIPSRGGVSAQGGDSWSGPHGPNFPLAEEDSLTGW